MRTDGSVAWRAAHSDVVTDAQLTAGRIDLTTYSGAHVYLDAQDRRGGLRACAAHVEKRWTVFSDLHKMVDNLP